MVGASFRLSAITSGGVREGRNMVSYSDEFAIGRWRYSGANGTLKLIEMAAPDAIPVE